MSAPTQTARDALAELVNGGQLPKNPRTVGGIYERDTAYQRADAIIAAGWRPPAISSTGGSDRRAVHVTRERERVLIELRKAAVTLHPGDERYVSLSHAEYIAYGGGA